MSDARRDLIRELQELLIELEPYGDGDSLIFRARHALWTCLQTLERVPVDVELPPPSYSQMTPHITLRPHVTYRPNPALGDFIKATMDSLAVTPEANSRDLRDRWIGIYLGARQKLKIEGANAADVQLLDNAFGLKVRELEAQIGKSVAVSSLAALVGQRP